MAVDALLRDLSSHIATLDPICPMGRVQQVQGGVLEIAGLGEDIALGDRVHVKCRKGPSVWAEVVQLGGKRTLALPQTAANGVCIGDPALAHGPVTIAPAERWLGRVIDPEGRPLDGEPLLPGATARPLRNAAPDPVSRRPLGARLSTGLAVTNTFLPIVQGQRIGLFAGSGVGKSSLLGALASHMQADVVVIALIGERGREVRHFIENVIGQEGMRRCIVIAATSDRSALMRRQCAWTAMSVAEHFRDLGQNVLLLADSITRFAEAHREVAIAAGEVPVLRGYPASTPHMIMSLCERAGPGADAQGDMTALFSVLVAGSDMEEPIADILRGVLDGHIVLDRAIAERGRFPAVDVLQSISRSLPAAASPEENALLQEARRLLGLYDRNAVMIRAGLYSPGSDPALDQAVALWPDLDAFLAKTGAQDCAQSFAQLKLLLRRAGIPDPAQPR